MVWTVPIDKVAQYTTWSLIFWDYMITLDDEVCPYTSSRVGLFTDRLEDHFVLGASSFWLGPISVWHLKIGWTVLKKVMDQILVLCGLVLRIWDTIWEHLKNAVSHFCDIKILPTPHLTRMSCFHIIFAEMAVISEVAYEACYVGTESASVLYVTIQLLIIETILVLRIWAIMGKQRRILWTFLGFLVCSTAASLLISIFLGSDAGFTEYVIPTLIFEAIMFICAAYHGIKQSGGVRSLLLRDASPFRYGPTPILRLVFQGSVLYFTAVLCSLPLMAFLDPRFGITIMSVTINHMLLRLRKQGLSDTVGPPSQVELTTLRATANGAMSSELWGDVIDIGPYPQGS
ncbi:hypothetical protein EDD85DRAFT_982003 [Armillaria nabsnona]|nr:hypothetical protein EDD85DRAFT_982003 [Armillaria nabsnona]